MPHNILTKKSLIILGVIIVLAGVAGSFLYFKNVGNGVTGGRELARIKKDYPGLSANVDKVAEWQAKLDKDKADILNYNGLGFAWKDMAEKALAQKLDNYKDYYAEALNVYQAGIEASQRKNTLLMMNAANMARNLGNYSLAEDYMREAITVSPGDESYYVSLIELYEFDLKKGKDEVLKVYDEGLKRVLNRTLLQKRKESYLEKIGEASH